MQTFLNVISVLASHGVKATFFVNSRKLTDWPDVGPVSLLAAVEAGHLIGDHSFDHMEANTGPQTSAYAYRNVTQDKKWVHWTI